MWLSLLLWINYKKQTMTLLKTFKMICAVDCAKVGGWGRWGGGGGWWHSFCCIRKATQPPAQKKTSLSIWLNHTCASTVFRSVRFINHSSFFISHPPRDVTSLRLWPSGRDLSWEIIGQRVNTVNKADLSHYCTKLVLIRRWNASKKANSSLACIWEGRGSVPCSRVPGQCQLYLQPRSFLFSPLSYHHRKYREAGWIFTPMQK